MNNENFKLIEKKDKYFNKSFFKDSLNETNNNFRSKSNNKNYKLKRKYNKRPLSPISRYNENSNTYKILDNDNENNSIIIDFDNLRKKGFEIKRINNEKNINENMKKMSNNIESYWNKLMRQINNIKNGVIINSKSYEIESNVIKNKLEFNKKTLNYFKQKNFDINLKNVNDEQIKYEEEERKSIINSYKKTKYKKIYND